VKTNIEGNLSLTPEDGEGDEIGERELPLLVFSVEEEIPGLVEV